MGKNQLSLDQVLKAVIEKWKRGPDSKWFDALNLPDIEKAYPKGQDLNPWGLRVQKAIADLPKDRCDELTVIEIAAYMLVHQKTAEARLKKYRAVVPEGTFKKDKGWDGGYHLDNAHQGIHARFHYHRNPFQAFLDKQAEALHQTKVTKGHAAWLTSGGLARRQGKQRNDDRRRADSFAAAAQLAADRLAGQPDLAEALKALAESQALLKAQGISIKVELQHMPAFAAFMDAQTQDLSRGVTEPQPWITDAKGRVVDHAGWPLAGAGTIRQVLEKGGTLESMPLMTALKRDWKPGNAFFLWSAVAELAVDRWREDHQKRLPTMRAQETLAKGKNLPSRERIRS
jgi:hypothetical protein